jgi:hypothetical protein
MPFELGIRWRRLFAADAAAAEATLFANAYAALGLALAVLLRWELDLGPTLAVAGGAFLLLGACLLFRPMMWLALLIGGGAVAVGWTLLLTMVTLRVHHLAGWAGAAVGIGTGVRFTMRSYLRLILATRAAVPATDPRR